MVESRTVSAAARTVAQGKEALTWAWTYHPELSGLESERYPWWKERWAIKYQAGVREHTPTTVELVRTLLVAERHLALGTTTQQTGPGMLAALWAVVLTGQRTGALAKTKRSAIKQWSARSGWEVWTWTGRQMKGGKNAGRPHGLPIPPTAIAAVAHCGPHTERSSSLASLNRTVLATAVGSPAAKAVSSLLEPCWGNSGRHARARLITGVLQFPGNMGSE